MLYQLRLSPLPLAAPKGESLARRKQKRDARKLRRRVRRQIARAEEFAVQRSALIKAQAALLATLEAENSKMIEKREEDENHK